jgi:membrane dipeptidase
MFDLLLMLNNSTERSGVLLCLVPPMTLISPMRVMARVRSLIHSNISQRQVGYVFRTANRGIAVSTTLSQIDLLHRLQAAYPNVFSPYSLNSASALAAFKANHSLVSPISIEGLHQIPQSSPLSTLRLYYLLGVRAATLTHNCVNAFADPALVTSKGELVPAPPYWNGLSPQGYSIIKEMNRLGMLVDLSHTSYQTQLDVLGKKGSRAPVFYSHSSAFALCPHPRNVHDDALRLVKETNSLVMVNFSPDFVSCTPSNSSNTLPGPYPKNSTLHQVARHVTYIGDMIGYDHVGLGSDFDGMFGTPRGLEDVSKFPDLVAELLRMGVKDADVSKVVGGNMLRVWGAAEKVSEKMKGETEGEDDVKSRFPELDELRQQNYADEQA